MLEGKVLIFVQTHYIFAFVLVSVLEGSLHSWFVFLESKTSSCCAAVGTVLDLETAPVRENLTFGCGSELGFRTMGPQIWSC